MLLGPVAQLPCRGRVVNTVQRLFRPLLVAVVATLVIAPSAVAAPPANDGPAAPSPFEPYNTQLGPSDDRQGIAELAEATPDVGVPRCLGAKSFARTVWFRVDPASTAREVTIEASGRTLEVVDLAAFVHNGVHPNTSRPNACVGSGSGGETSAEDRMSSITLHVPAGLPVLVQVGRRGPAESADDERAVLWMTETPLANANPPGDRADSSTPRIPRRGGRLTVPLGGATTSFDDPAAPECPSAGGVWRRMKPARSGRLTFSVSGHHAGALAVFSGKRPSSRRLVGCVDREGKGPLVLPVKVRKGRWLWTRIGTDRPPAEATVKLSVRKKTARDRLSGGSCLGAPRPLVRGELIGAPVVKERNRTRRLSVRLRVSSGPVCQARMTLIGPKGRTYGRASVFNVSGAGQVVSLRRTRRLARGRYVLKTNGAGLAGVRTAIRTRVKFTLR